MIGTTAVIGDKAETEARQSLEDQIKRHLTDASVEAAATIGERFRKLQYGVLDVTAFALRDALQEVRARSSFRFFLLVKQMASSVLAFLCSMLCSR